MPSYIVNYKIGEVAQQKPWGTWRVTNVGYLGSEEGGLAFCDKILTVSPGQILSMQRHEFRQEDWRIVEGRAKVFIGSNPNNLVEYHLQTGNEIHIPLGFWHRIGNAGHAPMVFAEKQSGICLD